ncbi:transporter [Lachnospiraceae bacterium KM106-2]|nr:transporter [Lachnospiraceae bacterium KM106-2]
MNTKKKYLILVSCFLLMMFPYSIVNTIQSLFLAPVITEKGFTNAGFSLIFTIAALTVALCSPLVGILIRKLNLKLIMTISALLVGGGFACYGAADRISTFYFIAILVSIGLTGLTMIPVATMIASYFNHKKGIMMGIAFAGTGFGTIFWMQLVSRFITRYGYHKTYFLLGMSILVVSLPITIFIVDKGPYDSSNQKDTSVIKKKEKWSFGHTGGNYSFYLFTLGLFLMGIAISGTKVHVQPFLNFSGYSTVFSANVGSLLAFMAVVGNIITGMFIDKAGLLPALLTYGVLTFISTILLQFIGIIWVPFLFAICFGACLSLPTLLPSYGVNKLFSDRSYSFSLGICNAFFTIGGAIGPSLTGFLADTDYGYESAFLSYSVIIVLYTILLYRIIHKRVTIDRKNGTTHNKE